MFRQERIPDGAGSAAHPSTGSGRTPRTGHKHIKACQPDGMYLTARATWFVATDSLTTAKYEHVLGHNGYCSAFN